MVYISGRRSTETAASAISHKDGFSLLMGDGAGFLRITATQDYGNAGLNGLANQWITFVTVIPQRCPCVANNLSRLLALLTAKERPAQRTLLWKLFIAILADAYLIGRINVIVPRTVPIFVAIRIPALHGVYVAHIAPFFSSNQCVGFKAGTT